MSIPPSTYFTFNVYIAGEGNDENSKSNNRQSPSFPGKNHPCSKRNAEFSCSSNLKSYKIHSLNESTLYELIVEQYDGSGSFLKK